MTPFARGHLATTTLSNALAIGMGALALGYLVLTRSPSPGTSGTTPASPGQGSASPPGTPEARVRTTLVAANTDPGADSRIATSDAARAAARADAIASRSLLRAFEGAPPVIPHPIADLHVRTCRECHARGLRIGGTPAREMSHDDMTNCTQCHVESPAAQSSEPESTFVGRRASEFQSLRAWAGAPPTIPHSIAMRSRCTSCHGEFGHEGLRPDHLSRTNCTQCHSSTGEFDEYQVFRAHVDCTGCHEVERPIERTRARTARIMPAKPQACDACHKPGFGARMIPFWQGATRTMYASLSAELAASARAGVQDTPALATAREMLSRISQDGSWGVHNPGETWRLLGKVRECIHGAEQNREQIQ